MYQHLYNRLQGQYFQERSWLSMPSFNIGLTYTEWVAQLYHPIAPLPTWRSDKLSCRGCWNSNEDSDCEQSFKLGENGGCVRKRSCLHNLRHLNEREWRTVLHNEIIPRWRIFCYVSAFTNDRSQFWIPVLLGKRVVIHQSPLQLRLPTTMPLEQGTYQLWHLLQHNTDVLHAWAHSLAEAFMSLHFGATIMYYIISIKLQH